MYKVSFHYGYNSTMLTVFRQGNLHKELPNQLKKTYIKPKKAKKKIHEEAHPPHILIFQIASPEK